jgi:hypothetical protein
VTASACSIESCGRAAVARGWCARHWQRWATHGDPTVSLINRDHDGSCTVDGCDRPYAYSGLCKFHAERRRRHGSAHEAEDLTRRQNGRCAVCRRAPDGRRVESVLHRDHDHVTGKVRGMLCGRCNKALGLLRDDLSVITSFIGYLRPFYAPAVEEVA